jgi:hypothetical protein
VGGRVKACSSKRWKRSQRLAVLPDEAAERKRRRVEHGDEADAAHRFASLLDAGGDRRLVPGEAAPLVGVVVLAAEVGLVHLDAAAERGAAELRHPAAQLVQPGPRRLVLEPVLAGHVRRLDRPAGLDESNHLSS